MHCQTRCGVVQYLYLQTLQKANKEIAKTSLYNLLDMPKVHEENYRHSYFWPKISAI